MSNINEELDVGCDKFDKVVLSFRVNRDLRDRAHKIARSESRTLANWYELILTREVQKREGKESSLEDKLDYICDKLDLIREHTKNIKPTSKSSENKESNVGRELQQIFELDLPETLSLESWKKWIIYKRRKRHYLTVESAKGLLERWEEADYCGNDLDELVSYAMQAGNNDAVYEKHLKKKEKPYWHGAK